MKEKTCCFTGHRIVPYESEQQIKLRVCDEVEALIEKGFRYFICGGALGFDTIAATAVLAIKKRHNEIKLKLMLPCRDQDVKWNNMQRLHYQYLSNNADSIEILNEGYVSGCMHQRNRKMVDESSVCIAYLNKNGGGTVYTVNYALEKGLKVINIAEDL